MCAGAPSEAGVSIRRPAVRLWGMSCGENSNLHGNRHLPDDRHRLRAAGHGPAAPLGRGPGKAGARPGRLARGLPYPYAGRRAHPARGRVV
jgi:hypothetical protein